ncbi:FeoA family protein [Phycisphaera mikurensis]|uniref:FeoA family protein n=1 Tax=Phycisphaera mikurensis (strain NBRC 102666 / KCTC 22515 / FYK2301M01) TaxID=1142394 RepID=I0IJ21_PHYMF|nr:FeoA family protein [Phycisphaera mikurensis]MBB6443106.1 hypothetical protein [Phycisphaera mikurensis]BAM05259.1 FeoA family protein [Phycisphaera mikurensis NBRC 102666]
MPDAPASPPTPAQAGCLSPGSVRVVDLARGQVAVIDAVDDDAGLEPGRAGVTDTLKRLGLCVGRKVQVDKIGDPLILKVLGSRVGVARRLAERLHAQPCTRSEAEPRAADGTRLTPLTLSSGGSRA